MAHRVGRNEPCPCGSGKKYKKCCWGKTFEYVEEDDGTVYRNIPLNDEAMDVLREQHEKFIDVHGRPPGPGDQIFFDLPPTEHLEHEMVQTMQEIGMAPDKVYAFSKTGSLVFWDSRDKMPESQLREWDDAIDEYHERFGEVLELPLPWKKSELSGKTIGQICEDERTERYIADYAKDVLTDKEKVRRYSRVVKAAMSRLSPEQLAKASEEAVNSMRIDDPAESMVNVLRTAAMAHEAGMDAVTAFEIGLFVDDFATHTAKHLGVAENESVKEWHESVRRAQLAMFFIALQQHYGFQETPERGVRGREQEGI
jgi:hypothetical protein